jgi:hypothetical protein
MKGIQPESFYWNSYRFGQGCNKKFYNAVCFAIELLSTYSFFTEGKTHIKLMLDTLFSAWCHSNAIYREKCSVCNDILSICNKLTKSYSVLQQCYYVKLCIVQVASVKCYDSANN